MRTDARGYVRAIAAGNYEKAYLIARGPNPLASICGRVCGAPCEANCRRGSVDSPIAIRALKRFASERYDAATKTAQEKILAQLKAAAAGLECGDVDELGPLALRLESGGAKPGSGQRLAIVGSGPAGLSAAHDLALFGFKPVIYEQEDVSAGMLYLGVPQYRLPREIISAEVEFIKALGVEIRTGVEVGKDVTLTSLLEEYAAVLIAVGAPKSRILPLDGIQGGGVLGGIEFLRDVNLDRQVTLGKEVLVIGGGNVAYDVARSTVRHLEGDVARSAVRLPGVHQVRMCCLESRAEMPADDIEIEEGAEEGIELHPSLGPDKILRDADGKITGVRFKAVASVFDEQGNFAPKFKDNEFVEIKADTVIFAIGQAFDLDFLEAGKNGVELQRSGLPKVDENLCTTRPGLYAAGDVAHGPSLIINAIASGKQAARSICAVLTGKQPPREAATRHGEMLDYSREPDFEKVVRQAIPATDSDSRKRSRAIAVERGYAEAGAVCEAGRCYDCGVNTIFEGNKCILCGGCADVCPELCLQLVNLESLAGGAELASLRAALEKAGKRPRSAIIKDETRCIRCGCCAERCPVGAITMERFSFKEVAV